MTRDELIRELDALGVSRRSYVLGDDPNDSERYCARQIGPRWYVYYSERGTRRGEQSFGTPDDAYDHLFELLSKDSTTRRRRNVQPGSGE